MTEKSFGPRHVYGIHWICVLEPSVGSLRPVTEPSRPNRTVISTNWKQLACFIMTFLVSACWPLPATLVSPVTWCEFPSDFHPSHQDYNVLLDVKWVIASNSGFQFGTLCFLHVQLETALLDTTSSGLQASNLVVCILESVVKSQSLWTDFTIWKNFPILRKMFVNFPTFLETHVCWLPCVHHLQLRLVCPFACGPPSQNLGFLFKSAVPVGAALSLVMAAQWNCQHREACSSQ